MVDNENPKAGWTVTREVPIGLIVAFLAQALIQTVVTTMYITKMDARILRLEEKNIEEKVANNKLLEMPDRLTRSEYETLGLKEGFKRLESKIDLIALENARRTEKPWEQK